MKKFAIALVAALSIGVLAGCGGGGGATHDLTVDMGENNQMVFHPAELTVKKGDKVKITLNNHDTGAEHSFVIKEFSGAKSTKIAPGKTGEITFTADKTGDFEFYCDVAGHKEGGMHGTIKVEG